MSTLKQELLELRRKLEASRLTGDRETLEQAKQKIRDYQTVIKSREQEIVVQSVKLEEEGVEEVLTGDHDSSGDFATVNLSFGEDYRCHLPEIKSESVRTGKSPWFSFWN
jgi:hypothetical protein